MRRTFRADPTELSEIRTFVRERAAEAGLAEHRSADIVLAVSEACANAILHSGTDELTIDWDIEDDRIVVTIRDNGVFRRRVPMPEVEGVGGHGIPLMMALVDGIEIREGTSEHPGTLVRLTVRDGRSSSIAS
ncbi:MAG TPA: ATP-binding protein [Actinomycetota bacterium]|nr:ATP-binding protein [Actinomycetota bacterium]